VFAKGATHRTAKTGDNKKSKEKKRQGQNACQKPPNATSERGEKEHAQKVGRAQEKTSKKENMKKRRKEC